MITLTREEAQQVLDALKQWKGFKPEYWDEKDEAAIELLRARLAEPEQESADDDDQAWDRNAERLTKEAFGLGGGINLNATSIDDLFVYEDAPTTGRTEPEKEPEPVAWRTFDGEGGYEYRDYDMNESYAEEWAKQNPNHANWVEPLFLKD